METNGVKQKLLGFGFSIMEGVDPNPDNYVCASILYSRSQQVGCLCRLEPNAQASVRLYVLMIISKRKCKKDIKKFLNEKNMVDIYKTKHIFISLQIKSGKW